MHLCVTVNHSIIILFSLPLSENYSIKYTFLEADLHDLFISYKQVISMLDKSEYVLKIFMTNLSSFTVYAITFITFYLVFPPD